MKLVLISTIMTIIDVFHVFVTLQSSVTTNIVS